MRLPVSHAAALAALILLGGCGAAGSANMASAPPPVRGPSADYPVLLGEPFAIDGTTYAPAEKLNYDAVGYASVAEGGDGVSGAHKTLPLPCYIEVTALTSGRTILVRLDRRGPMSNDYLVELSPDAATQLGVAEGEKAPVRVRRVNPPEQERAMLRARGRAAERMATPKPLLDVLMRKLAGQKPLMATAPNEAPPPPPPPVVESDPPKQVPPPMVKNAGTTGSLVVQVAAFSAEERARSAAGKLGGAVSKPGRYWLTRLGPFAARADAEAALAKARAAGYSDARIQRAD